MSTVPKALGKYQLLEPVGRGGMGEVYKAFQPDLNRHVAIKMLLAGERATEDFLQRFQREARMAARLTHPNIVQVYDFGTEGSLHYIVMEYVEGHSLKEILAERKLDVEQALRIGHSVARTLQFAHEQKIVHRDIKPANLVVDRQGRVRILDFGLAKSLADGKALTATSVMIGTPYYMSPEQAFAAPEEVDHRTDLYSLGAVLYEMLAGRPPFEGGTVLALLRKIEDQDPAPPGVSPAVDALVLKALAKDRERRFQTAAEMAEAIKACLTATSTRAMPGATARALVGRPFPWPAAGAAALILAVLAAWAVWPRGAVSDPGEASAVPDPAAEVRALLDRKTDVTAEELSRYREDPQLRRLIAQHFQKRGQFSRALDDLRGYERAIVELGSARGLQRFASPALFKLSIQQPRDLRGGEALLVSALQRHLEGKNEAARLKLKAAAANGAYPGHVLLVRAHLDLWECWPDPASEESQARLVELREALEKSEELYHLPLLALVRLLEGESDAAREVSDRLARLSPRAAEPYVLSAILFQRAGRIDLAITELETAQGLDPRNFDASIQRQYLRWMEVLNDPDNETLDIEDMREVLDDRLRNDHYPIALFLRAVLHALDSRWEEAEEDLRKMARRTVLDRVSVDNEVLASFVGAGYTRSRLFDAAATLQEHLGRREAALASSELITGEELPDEERRTILREKHRRMARLSVEDEPKVLSHLEEAIKLGAAPQDLRADPAFAMLGEKRAFQELLRRYEER